MEVAHSKKHLIHENSVCSDTNRNVSLQVSTSVIEQVMLMEKL